jgi:O-antigen/teichoic acid export membrane protein
MADSLGVKSSGEGWSISKLFRGSFSIRVFYTFIGFVNSVLLARILGSEDYGVYVFCLSVVSLISVPTQFGIPLIVVREFAKNKAVESWGLMKGLTIRSHQFVLVVSTLLCILYLVWININPAGYQEKKIEALAWGLMLVPVLSLGALRDSMFRGLHHVIMAQLSESVIRPLLLFCGLVIILFFLGGGVSVNKVFLYYVVCVCVSFFVGWFLYSKKMPVEIKRARAEYDSRNWFLAAFPVGVVGAMQVLNAEISTVLLSVYATDSDIAFYRVAALGAGVVIIVLQVADSVAAPEFSRMFAKGAILQIESYVGKINKLIVLFTVPIVLVIVFAGKPALSFFYGESFEKSYLPMVVLTVGQFFNAATGSLALLLIMTGHQKEVTKAMTVALFLNVALHAVLLPAIGLLGAAVSTSIMLIMWNSLMWVQVKKKVGIKYYF